jgi:hypothetical protein
MLYPGKITVYLHDTIDTASVGRTEIEALRERVQKIVATPVEERLRKNTVEEN